MSEWTIERHEAGLTVLELLQRRLPAAPPSYLKQLLRTGRICRNGEPLQAAGTVGEGDRLGLPNSRRLQDLIAGQAAQAVEILFENRGILVAFKPSGMAVHRGTGHEKDHLVGRLQALMASRREPFRIAPVHRLDAATSGPVLFGKGRRATAILGNLFMDGAVKKTYLALVAGAVDEAGVLASPVPAKGKLKAARTGFRRLAAGGGFSLLELSLYSGRTHQIRRQLADCGHPLAGDRRYGGPCPVELPRLFLHCLSLAFTDPFENEERTIECALPPDLEAFLASRDLVLPPEAGGNFRI